MFLTSVANTLMVKGSDGCRDAVAYTSQNLIQVVRTSKNSVGDSRAHCRVYETKVGPVRAHNLEPVKGNGEVPGTSFFAYSTSEAIQE